MSGGDVYEVRMRVKSGPKSGAISDYIPTTTSKFLSVRVRFVCDVLFEMQHWKWFYL